MTTAQPPEPDKVVYVRNQPTGSKALTAGIVALCLSWLPFVGLILGILAFIYAIDGVKSQDHDVKSKSVIGMITGALAVLWPIVAFMGIVVAAIGSS